MQILWPPTHHRRIGSNWRSVDYLRGLAKRRKKGSSERQLAQQMKFALCTEHLRVIKDVLNIGFRDKKLDKISGYNAAAKYFLNEAITGEYPSFGVDYSKFRLSMGSLNPLHEVVIVPGEEISLKKVEAGEIEGGRWEGGRIGCLGKTPIAPKTCNIQLTACNT